jgi:hypothetical protein
MFSDWSFETKVVSVLNMNFLQKDAITKPVYIVKDFYIYN